MKKCEKCGKMNPDTEQKCINCGATLSTPCVQPDRYRKFAELLRDHKCQRLKTIRIISIFFDISLFILFFFSPLVVYDNGITISKVTNYSFINLCFGSNGSIKMLGTGSFIGFLLGFIIFYVGLMGILVFFCFQYDFSYAPSFLRMNFDGMDFQSMYKKRYSRGLLSLVIATIGCIVAVCSLTSLPGAFAKVSEVGNSSYWQQSADGWSVGWGGGILVGLFFLYEVFAISLFVITMLTEKNYVEGKCTDEDVLNLFQGGDHSSYAASSVSDQLKELDQLKKDGLISDADYEEKKKQILNL